MASPVQTPVSTSTGGAGEVSIADIERAIVEATLAGRHAVADVLADRLRAREAAAKSNVVAIRKRSGK